jgi:hypothetical protein
LKAGSSPLVSAPAWIAITQRSLLILRALRALVVAADLRIAAGALMAVHHVAAIRPSALS